MFDFWLIYAIFLCFFKNREKILYFFLLSFSFHSSFVCSLHPYLMQAVFKSFLPFSLSGKIFFAQHRCQIFTGSESAKRPPPYGGGLFWN